MPDTTLNIAERLREMARRFPGRPAVVWPAGRDWSGRTRYTQLSFQQLDQESDRLARGLVRLGVRPGTRMVLLVRPSLEFVTLTFALFKAGAVVVLIDPGMGRRSLVRCLAEVEPEGFVAVPVVHFFRRFYRRLFPRARLNVSVGFGWLTGAVPYGKLLGPAWEPFRLATTRPDDPAAVIFTSGSTGPPKGVLYEHRVFDAQVRLLRDFFDVRPGEVSLSGFPLFSLFDAAMGVTTVIPDMDPTRPARVDPERILAAVEDHGVCQAFGSPAMWERIVRYCESTGRRIPFLRRVTSAGAPVSPWLLERLRRVLAEEDAEVFTPYGATECLPVACVSSREVLGETAAKSRRGAGTCVGRLFPEMSVRIVEPTDGPIRSFDDARSLPPGQVGEIVVTGPTVTRQYVAKPEATAAAKIVDGGRVWHRMGDVGYLDDQGRLWVCGRKAHVVHTADGPLYPVPCEAVFNEHPRVFRSALVGVGPRGEQEPVVVVEPEPGQFPRSATDRRRFEEELLELAAANPVTARVRRVLFRKALPVDVRHNVKINRELLAEWAARKLNRKKDTRPSSDVSRPAAERAVVKSRTE